MMVLSGLAAGVINGTLAKPGDFDAVGTKYSGSTATRMLVDENVVDGKVHIGVLQGSEDTGQGAGQITNTGAESSMNAWKKPALEIDEDYIGTYHIYKNITLKTSYNQEERNESWLDCCNAGYPNIYWPDKTLVNAGDIFNCKAADPWKIMKAKDK